MRISPATARVILRASAGFGVSRPWVRGVEAGQQFGRQVRLAPGVAAVEGRRLAPRAGPAIEDVLAHLGHLDQGRRPVGRDIGGVIVGGHVILTAVYTRN